MSRRAHLEHIVIPAAVFTAAFAYLYAFHRLGWFMEDEGVLYYQYLRVYHGDLPYRDFFTGYGPIGYYLHAWAFSVFGVSINATRVLMAVVNATTAVGLYVLARRLTSWGFALIPPALFLVMQPGDIAVMVFHNSPYPSWYAVTFVVWGTWAMLRFVAARRSRTGAVWLVIAGFLGGLAFFSKQNTGTFFLWGITGFLASYPDAGLDGDGEESLLARSLRVGYLFLIVVATLLLLRNFLGPASVVAFVVPAAVLALLGAGQRFGPRATRALLIHFACVTFGFAAAILPWVAYFAAQMGLFPFLSAVLLLGTDVERNLYIPFPGPDTATVILLLPLVAWGLLVSRAVRRATRAVTPVRISLGVLTGVSIGAVCAAVAWQANVILGVLRFRYNLWQIYSVTSDGLDNLAAYLSIVVLVAALGIAWRQAYDADARHAAPEPEPARGPFLCVLWVAACSFILYYPRMDYAHLVGALPLLYVVGAALLSPMRRSLAVAFTQPNRQYVRLAFNVLCIVLTVFVVGTKSAPKVYSRTMVARGTSGIRFIPTPTERLDLERADLYFPIYLERQQRHIAAIRELIAYVRKITHQGEPIFAFPALSMVYFLSGRDNPTRHDYFLGDNVSFREQLDVIRTLERDRVATVVVSNDLTDYFVAKGADFTHVIWAYLRRRYYLQRRIGPYDVLRRYGSPAAIADTAGDRQPRG